MPCFFGQSRNQYSRARGFRVFASTFVREKSIKILNGASIYESGTSVSLKLREMVMESPAQRFAQEVFDIHLSMIRHKRPTAPEFKLNQMGS